MRVVFLSPAFPPEMIQYARGAADGIRMCAQ
jgi:hypothetical protein